jgi:glucokinase
MTAILGVDIGGTKTAVGPVDTAGVRLASPMTESTRAKSRESFLTGLEATLRHAVTEFAGFEPVAVGVACAGTVDGERGVVVASPNLPLEDVPLAAILEKGLRLPVFLENDVNAAVRAEAAIGAAAGLRHVVMITLGTGVGGGLWLDGRLYRGTGGGAGELGHMVVNAGGLQCPCGGHGCLEMYASGKALARYAAARVGDAAADPAGSLAALQTEGRLTGGAVSRLAREGYPGALEAVGELSRWLGEGLVNITNAFDPEMIVVGGGTGQLRELLLAPAREVVRRYAIPPGRDRVVVASAELGNHAGLVGGALAAWDALSGRGQSESVATGAP